MKNILRILKKSFLGIPVAIFLYEMFNLTIAIMMKQYVKIDGFDLNKLILDYIEYGITGYGIAFLINYMPYITKDPNKNEIEKSKSVINVFGTVIILVILIGSIIENDILFGLIVVGMITLLVLVVLFIIFLFDKKEVNSINNKIKGNLKKEE